MDYFETREVFDENTFVELERHLRNPREKRMFAIVLFSCFFALIVGIFISATVLIVSGIASSVFIALLFLRTRLGIQRTLERTRKSLGAEEVEYITTFADDQIKIHTLQTSATVYLNYDDISRFAETESLYALFTRANQFITVNKAGLIQEQKDEAFVQFIKDKCKNVKW